MIDRARLLTTYLFFAAALLLVVWPGAAFCVDPAHPEPSRADLALAEQQTVDVKGVEFYPRGTGPRGAISFARISVPVTLKRDELKGKDLVCLQPGVTPGETSTSFGLSLQISF